MCVYVVCVCSHDLYQRKRTQKMVSTLYNIATLTKEVQEQVRDEGGGGGVVEGNMLQFRLYDPMQWQLRVNSRIRYLPFWSAEVPALKSARPPPASHPLRSCTFVGVVIALGKYNKRKNREFCLFIYLERWGGGAIFAGSRNIPDVHSAGQLSSILRSDSDKRRKSNGSWKPQGHGPKCLWTAADCCDVSSRV